MKHMPSRSRTLVVLLASLTLATASAVAHADEASEAALQNQLAQELYARRRYGEALEHLLASNRLVPNPNVIFNIAQTYGLLRRYVDAYNWYETYLAWPDLDEAALTRGREARDAVARRVSVVTITTTPPGAELFVDRAELGSVGVSPRRIAVAAGAHSILARLPGHRDARSESFTATNGGSLALDLSLEAILGRLVVTSTPEGATVTRETDHAVLGVTPLSVEVPIGELRILVQADLHVEQGRTVVVRDGETTSVDVSLAMEASRVAVLTVEGTPESAEVVVSGEVLGSSPLTLQGMPPGTIDFEIRREDFEPCRGRALLEAGSATRVSFTLVEEGAGPPPGLRWLGYAGGGALALAGLGVGLAARSERSGFFDNPTRAAYDRVERLNHAADGLVGAGLVTLTGTIVIDLLYDVPESRAAVRVER